jgi:hypothetical protein
MKKRFASVICGLAVPGRKEVSHLQSTRDYKKKNRSTSGIFVDGHPDFGQERFSGLEECARIQKRTRSTEVR